MEGQEIIVSLAEELGPIAESSSDFADCALKASGKFKQYRSALLNAAVEIAFGRVRARKDLPHLAGGFFTKKGLQQRTHPKIAEHHGRLFEGCGNLLEVCTGLGFDTAALARKVRTIITLEKDPMTAFCARQNLNILGITNCDVVEKSFEEFMKTASLADFDGIWADPDRRPGGGRAAAGSKYEPSLDLLMSVVSSQRCGIKISPALSLPKLPAGWTRRWIGFEGECKEQLLLKGMREPSESVLLADCDAFWRPSSTGNHGGRHLTARFPEGEPFFLVEPHPVLCSSNLLDAFYEERGIFRWDADVVYGFSPREIAPDPFIQRFRIFFAAPYDERELRGKLAELGWDARTEIKKRAFPEEPEEVRKRLKLPPYSRDKTSHGVVVLSRNGKKLMMFLGNRQAG